MIKKIQDLEKEINRLRKENEKLAVKLKVLELKQLEKEKQFEQLVNEIVLEKEKNSQRLIIEQRLKNEIATWQKIVDEIAHSINTDVYIALTNLEKHKDLPRIQKSFYHIKQIRDLTNLLMWMIKKDEIKLSGDIISLNISELVNNQITTIKDGITTLRLSSDEHQENLLKLEVPVEGDFNAQVGINKEISESIGLILKDLLRNALKNTDEESPQVSVNIKSDDSYVYVEIKNNNAIKEEFSDWFNDNSHDEPASISKSTKVGLRVIKEWTKLLQINAQLLPNKEENYTITKVKFPTIVKYG